MSKTEKEAFTETHVMTSIFSMRAAWKVATDGQKTNRQLTTIMILS